MTDRYREFARIRNSVLFMSTVAWILLLAEPGTLAHCPVAALGAVSWRASLQMLVAMNLPASLAISWVLMLVAMMLPALMSPIYHVYISSFAHRRLRSITFFLAGYGTVWTVAGALLIAINLLMHLIAPHSFLPAIGAFLSGIVWQFSPIKQRSLNRCHSHEALTPFGVAADRAALRFGMTHGIWCACSCWVWMLCAMLLPKGHLVAMLAVAVLLFSERLERPRRPSWGPRGLGRATRIILAQAKIRFDASRPRFAVYSVES